MTLTPSDASKGPLSHLQVPHGCLLMAPHTSKWFQLPKNGFWMSPGGFQMPPSAFLLPSNDCLESLDASEKMIKMGISKYQDKSCCD